MKMLKPPMLRAGDTVAAISPSWGGPAAFPQRYQAGKQQLEATFGVRVVETPNALRDAAWLARNPQARADDLLGAFVDPQIRAVIATIGGDDSIRLLPYLDLGVLHDNPTILLGFSDPTVLHLACFAAGVVSFYGSHIMTGLAENGGIFPYTVNSLRRTLWQSDPLGLIEPCRDGWTVEELDWADPSLQQRIRRREPSSGWRWLQGEGVVRGRLLGGCIEVVDWLRGTSVWPPLPAWDGAVLFLETSEEAPSPMAVTRMLRCLGALGVLERIGALLFGRPGGAVPVARFAEYDQAILEVVAHELGRSQLPVVTGMDFGHTDPVFVLPYGVQAEIDCARQTLSIMESGVTDA